MSIVGYNKPAKMKKLARMKAVIETGEDGRTFLVGYSRKNSSRKRGGLRLRHPMEITRKPSEPPAPIAPPEPVAV